MEWILEHRTLMFILSLVAILLCILAFSEINTRKTNRWQIKKTAEYPEHNQKDLEHK